MKRLIAAAASLAILVALPTITSAQNEQEVRELLEKEEFSKIGVGTGTFLQIPVGARGVAMGGAFSAIADDASALHYNPAGITQIKGIGVTGSFSAMFAGIAHNYAGATFSIGESNRIGISANTLNSGDIPVTTLFEQEGTGGFYSASDLSIGLTYAQQVTDQFSYGATAKLVNLSIADVSATGIAFDFGTLYDPNFLGLRLAFAVNNLSAPITYDGPDLVERGRTNQTTGNREADKKIVASAVSLPLTFRAGLSANLMESAEDHNLWAATEFTSSSNAPEHLGVGLEYVWNDLVAARVGYQLGSADAFGLSGGLGLTYESGLFWGALDYAVRPHKTMGLVNTISASVRLR